MSAQSASDMRSPSRKGCTAKCAESASSRSREVRLDRRRRRRGDAEERQRPVHPIREARRGLGLGRHRDEVGTRLRDALREAPAVVHRRQQHELVGVELDEVRGEALHGRCRIERGRRDARFEAIEDVARVLPGLVLGCDDDRDEGEPGPRQDHAAIVAAGARRSARPSSRSAGRTFAEKYEISAA